MASHSSRDLLNTLPPHTRWNFLHQILIPNRERLKIVYIYMELLPKEGESRSPELSPLNNC